MDETRPYTINEALEKAKYGKFNYLMIIVTSFILLNIVLETLAISFIIPVAECDLDLTELRKSALGGISYIGIICSSHFWGYLADTLGRRYVIRPTLLLGFLATIISSFSTNFWYMISTRFINGLLISAGSATVYAYLGEFHSNEKRNTAIMYSAFVCAIIGFFLPLGAWLVINFWPWHIYIPYLNIIYKPWRVYTVFSGTCGLISGLLLFKLPESPKFLLSIGNNEAALEVLRKMFVTNTGHNVNEFKVSKLILEEDEIRPTGKPLAEKSRNLFMQLFLPMWKQTSLLFSKKFLLATILMCYIEFWMYFTAHGLYLWLPEMINYISLYTNAHPNDQHQPICDLSYLGSTMQKNWSSELEMHCNETLEFSTFYYAIVLEAIYVVLFGIMIFCLKYTSRGVVFCAVMVFCGFCGVGTVFITLPDLSLYLFTAHLLSVLAVSLLSSIIVDIFPTHLRATAICLALMAGRIGIVFGTNVVGLMLKNYCKPLFLLSSIALIVNGILIFFLPIPDHRKDIKSLHI